jgi:hypothetical protein
MAARPCPQLNSYLEANGDADNQVMLVEDNTYGLFSTQSPVLVEALLLMDRWLLAIEADESDRDPHEVVVEAKPADLAEACYAPDGTKIVEEQVYQGDTRCNELYPSFASPRIVAGGPLASDVITCQLREPVRSDYPEMTDEQWQYLQDVFPAGVCDYSQPGVDETGIAGTWAFFTAPGKWTFHQPKEFEAPEAAAGQDLVAEKEAAAGTDAGQNARTAAGASTGEPSTGDEAEPLQTEGSNPTTEPTPPVR